VIHFLLLDAGNDFVSYSELDDEYIVLGRGSDADLRVEDTAASREHCRIRLDEGVWSAEDLGSHNGTRLNLAPLTERMALKSLDLLSIGSHRCYVWIGDLPEHALGPNPFGVCQELGLPFRIPEPDAESPPPSEHWLTQAFLDGPRREEEKRAAQAPAKVPTPEPTPQLSPALRNRIAARVEAGKFANTCPSCGIKAYFGRDTRPIHGNYLSPAANSEVEVTFECLACDHEETRLL
jgi:FHA domain-containing protein